MNFYEYLAHLEATDTPFALVTIVHAGENSPGRTSFKMCVTEDGAVVGSVGGGALEYNARNSALEMLKSGERTRLVTYKLKDKAAGGIGMACGGEAQVFIETISPRRQLVIFGGGHIGAALTRCANDVGFDVTVIDNRPEFADKSRHPQASRVIVADYDALGDVPLPQKAFFVIVTHQHIGDNDCLKALLKRPDLDPCYIGLIGSAKKLARVFNNMIDEGFSRSALEQIHAPIGIDTGGQSANEIAVGIAAQIIAAKYGKTLADSMDQKKHPLSIDVSKADDSKPQKTLFDHGQI